ILDQLRHGSSHRLEHQYGPVEPGELPQPGIRPLRPEERGDERISCHDQIRKGTDLDDPALVTRRFGVAIRATALLIRGLGLALPGMRPAAGVDEPGMAHVLRDLEVGERLDLVRLAVVEAGRMETTPIFERGGPPARVVVASGAEQIRRALPRVLQPYGS